MSDVVETFRNVLRNFWDWATMGGVIKGNLESADQIIKFAAEEAGLPYSMLYVTLINDKTGEVIDDGNIIDVIADHSGMKASVVGLSMIADSINIWIEEEEKENA